MPHTNRKKSSQNSKPKPLIVHSKRQQIEDNDGWTHVIEAPRRANPARGKEWLHAGDFEKNGVSYINRTLAEVRKDFEHYTKQWEDSEASGALRSTLAENNGVKKVENVIVLGLGSLQSARREGRRASYTQLAALRTVVEVLGMCQRTVGYSYADSIVGEGLDCTFQDPQFTDLDVEFLASLGYAVVEDPKAIGKIGNGSLVYAIHCYADVYLAVSEGPRPAMMVVTDVGNFGRFNVYVHVRFSGGGG